MKYTCSMETVQKNGRFTLFLVNSSLYILFSMLILRNIYIFVGLYDGYLKINFSELNVLSFSKLTIVNNSKQLLTTLTQYINDNFMQ